MRLYFGDRLDLAYVLNPKAACTFALNFLFLANNGHEYFDAMGIHHSRYALYSVEDGPDRRRFLRDVRSLFPRRTDPWFGAAPNPTEAKQRFVARKFQTFTLVRDPLARFVSAFIAIIFANRNPDFIVFRDFLTSKHGVDLSPGADRKLSCLRFAEWLEKQPNGSPNRHFRLQFYNLAGDRNFHIDHVFKLSDGAAVDQFLAQFLPADQFASFRAKDINKTSNFDQADFISDELRAKIKKIYALDYDHYFA